MRKKALFVFPRPIFPIIGGDQIRAYQQLSFLIEEYDVYLLYICEENQCDDYALEYMPQLKGSKSFQQSKLFSFFRMFLSFFNLKPLQVNYYTNNSLKKYIKKNSSQYDLIFSGNPRVAEHIVNLPEFKVLDFVDAASMNCLNARSKARGVMKIFYTIDYHLMKRYEQKMIKLFDRCAIISEVDKKFIEKWMR